MVLLSQFLHLLRSQARVGEHSDLCYINDMSLSLLKSVEKNKQRGNRDNERSIPGL